MILVLTVYRTRSFVNISPDARKSRWLIKAMIGVAIPIMALAAPQVFAVATEKTVVVGTHVAPPFVVQNPDGTFSGISVDLWKNIAEDLGLKYEMRAMPIADMLEGLRDGTLDVVAGALTVTAERVRQVDFSHPFFTSGLAIALVRDDNGKLESALKAVFSLQFLQALTALVVVLFVIGLFIWLLERRANRQQFGGKAYQGVGAGFWWAAVTMTTVGYGDKAPVTFWGRLLATIWMFASVITISGFTAAIASVFTLQEIEGLINGPQDLNKVVTGTIKDSTSSEYAINHRLRTVAYSDVEAALAGLAERDVGAVVYDAPILNYLATSRPDRKIEVLPNTFMRQDYAFGLPQESPLREALNAALLDHLVSDRWQETLSRYLGSNILDEF